MESSMEIRKAEISEATILSKIAYDSKSFWGYSQELLELWKDDLTITPEFITTNVVRCATVKTTIIGFYALTISDSNFELEHLWIKPSYIGKGAGSKLLADATRQVAVQKGKKLKILTDPNAEGFYLKKGAVRIGKLPSKPAGRMLPLLQLNVQNIPAV